MHLPDLLGYRVPDLGGGHCVGQMDDSNLMTHIPKRFNDPLERRGDLSLEWSGLDPGLGYSETYGPGLWRP